MVRVGTPPSLPGPGVFFGFAVFCFYGSLLPSSWRPCRPASAGLRSKDTVAAAGLPRLCIFPARFRPIRAGRLMKLIVAIIQPSRLEAVKAALSQVEVFRLTLMDVQGFGRQKGHTETYRGHDLAVNLLRKVRLEIAVNDDFVEPTIQAIVEGGRSGRAGEIGDGKIFVLPMDDCVRIRTGERGSEAI